MNAVVNFPISETLMIDELAELDSKIKFYTEQSKKLKDKIANFYGEGKHRGNTFGVNVSLYQSTTYDYKKMIADLGITQDTLSKYAKHSATIRVSVTA